MTSSSSVGWNLNPGANAVGGGAGSDGVSRRILFEIFFFGVVARVCLEGGRI